MKHYTTPGPNSRLNSKFKIDNKLTYLDNISLHNIEEKLLMSEKSNVDTNSEYDVSVNLDTSEPHATMAKMDSVTAVLSVEKNSDQKSVLDKT